MESPDLPKYISDQDEALIIYDSLLVDYAMLLHNIHSEEFKATFTKFDLLDDPSLKTHNEFIAKKIFEIKEKL